MGKDVQVSIIIHYYELKFIQCCIQIDNHGEQIHADMNEYIWLDQSLVGDINAGFSPGLNNRV